MPMKKTTQPSETNCALPLPANEKLPEPVNLKAVADALSAYSELSKEHKKEFWSRTIGKIVITNTDDFFVFPISP